MCFETVTQFTVAVYGLGFLSPFGLYACWRFVKWMAIEIVRSIVGSLHRKTHPEKYRDQPKQQQPQHQPQQPRPQQPLHNPNKQHNPNNGQQHHQGRPPQQWQEPQQQHGQTLNHGGSNVRTQNHQFDCLPRR
jgi:hypothetical protein